MSKIRNALKCAETPRHRLLISRFQVRVLGDSLLIFLQNAEKTETPRFVAGAL